MEFLFQAFASLVEAVSGHGSRLGRALLAVGVVGILVVVFVVLG